MTRTSADEMQAIAVQIHALALRIRHSQGVLGMPRAPLQGAKKSTKIAGGATPRGGLDEGGQVAETPLLNGHRN